MEGAKWNISKVDIALLTLGVSSAFVSFLSFVACLLIVANIQILRLAQRRKSIVLVLFPLVLLPYVLPPSDEWLFELASAPFWVCALLLTLVTRKE